MEGDVKMNLIPAIDLKDGNAVRLYQGDYSKQTVYSENPVELANKLESMGADYLHIVDLDGAKDGKEKNIEMIKKIRNAVKIPIEVGGGIRNEEILSKYLEEIKVNRVILGTIAVENQEFVKRMIEKYRMDRIIVGIDIKDGLVRTRGWKKQTDKEYLDFIQSLKNMGVHTVIVTDIKKDGTMQEPNWEIYQKIKRNIPINIIVSGGIGNKENIYKVAREGYDGCIIGKAFYEGKIDIKEVKNCLKKELYHV